MKKNAMLFRKKIQHLGLIAHILFMCLNVIGSYEGKVIHLPK